MPLSEHEQRLLDEMERSLYHEDGDVVASVGHRRGRPGYSSIVLGILIAVLGVAALIVGVFLQLTVLGIVGFVVMFGGVLLAVAPSRRSSTSSSSPPDEAHTSKADPQASGFMDRLNERWDKRQDGHG